MHLNQKLSCKSLKIIKIIHLNILSVLDNQSFNKMVLYNIWWWRPLRTSGNDYRRLRREWTLAHRLNNHIDL